MARQTLLLRHDQEIFEVTRAIGLRSEPNLAGGGWPEHRIVCGRQIRIRYALCGRWFSTGRVLKRQAFVQPRLEVRAMRCGPAGTVWNDR